MAEPDMSLMQQLAHRAKLESGGGGSDDGGMEQRVAALETEMREVKAGLGRVESILARLDGRFDKFDDRLRKVEVDVARVDGRVAHLPSTWTLVIGCFGTAFTVAGLVLAIIRFGLPH
jgi:hypothetical protein